MCASTLPQKRCAEQVQLSCTFDTHHHSGNESVQSCWRQVTAGAAEFAKSLVAIVLAIGAPVTCVGRRSYYRQPRLLNQAASRSIARLRDADLGRAMQLHLLSSPESWDFRLVLGPQRLPVLQQLDGRLKRSQACVSCCPPHVSERVPRSVLGKPSRM
jgi:hypothetical protein